MNNPTHPIPTNRPLGDTAVDGLLGGLLAGAAMLALLLLLGLLRGAPAAQTLGRFAAGAGGAPLVGLLLHLAVSGIYGMLFALLARGVRAIRPFGRYLLGGAYGLLLFALARGVLLPAAGSALLAIPAPDLLLAHLAYGLVLDHRQQRIENG